VTIVTVNRLQHNETYHFESHLVKEVSESTSING